MSEPTRRRTIALGLLVAGALGAGGYALIEGALRTSEESDRADTAVWTAEELCAQVEALGQQCVRDPEDLKAEPGPAGPPGEAGRGIFAAECIGGTWQITYSDGEVDQNAGACTGSRGPAGENGTDGEDGTDGTPGADSTVPGPAGSDGADGSDGRGITDAECSSETGRWRVTYSDGSVDEDAGPCVADNSGPLD